MTYRLRTGERARFELEDAAITLASRGGSSKKGNAINEDYGKALRIILERLMSAGIGIADAYIDSGPMQSLPIPERRIFGSSKAYGNAADLFRSMSKRMERVGQQGEAKPGNSTKRIRIALAGDVSKQRLIEVLDAVPIDTRSTARLPASELWTVTATDLFLAREELLETRDLAPFDDSDEYDVLLEDGQRLPPKALLGRALSKTLGYQIQPKHFSGGASSTCFLVLHKFGYMTVDKNAGGSVVAPRPPPPPPEDREWPEGDKKGRWHLASERKSGLAAAKKQEFRLKNGKLWCEKCGLDPLEQHVEFGEACIEVHHAYVAVADMQPGHKTKLSDLQCLCANCHRIEHQRMRGDVAR